MSTYHNDVCDGNISPKYDRDSGRHIIGWTCDKCSIMFKREHRERFGATFKYVLPGT